MEKFGYIAKVCLNIFNIFVHYKIRDFHNRTTKITILTIWYWTGADTVILARLAPGNDQVKAETQEHLDVSLKYFNFFINKGEINYYRFTS